MEIINPVPLPADTLAPLHKQLHAFFVVCPHNYTTILNQIHSIRLTNVNASVSSQIKHHCSVSSSIHLVLSVSGVHQVCCDVLIPIGKLT